MVLSSQMRVALLIGRKLPSHRPLLTGRERWRMEAVSRHSSRTYLYLYVAIWNLEACKAYRIVIWGSSDSLVKNCGGILVDYELYVDKYEKCAGGITTEIFTQQ